MLASDTGNVDVVDGISLLALFYVSRHVSQVVRFGNCDKIYLGYGTCIDLVSLVFR